MSTFALDRPIDFSATSGINQPAPFMALWEGMLGGKYGTASFSVVSDSEKALSFLKSKGVSIDAEIEVEQFLASHSSLISHLYEIPQVVTDNFGKTRMRLALFSDPDATDVRLELYLEIETSLSPVEADVRLRNLNRNWLLQIDSADAYLFSTSLRFS